MDIDSFLLTAIMALLSGLALGAFGREMIDALWARGRRVYGKPHYLQAYRKPHGNPLKDEVARH